MELLSKDKGMHRSVSYFANELCYTPKHFSKVIKQACGRTPLDLINETTVEHIKYRLKRSEKSIKEIAEEFNFPNQSFFGKYVKAHLGTSPANYRNRKEEWQKEHRSGGITISTFQMEQIFHEENQRFSVSFIQRTENGKEKQAFKISTSFYQKMTR